MPEQTQHELTPPQYQFDFTSYLKANPGYVRLEDDTARHIINTMEQMMDNRNSYPDRPKHYPFPQARNKGMSFSFQGDIKERAQRSSASEPFYKLGDTVRLSIKQNMGLLEGRREVAALEGAFQKVGDVIQSAFAYVNWTDKEPQDKQIHNVFGVLLPYKSALCQVVANYEQKPVVDMVRPPIDKPHWVELLKEVGYVLNQQETAYVRQFNPEQPVTGSPHEVGPVRR
jgi:hypothetical protein